MDNKESEFLKELKDLVGMEGIIAQFKRYLADMRACRESNEKFRKHMVFMGNPGTGKTTVARIFADVLCEEGLLDNGRLHQVTVGDLMGLYIGQTRVMTQEVCQRARGGVLFIDEAYGLYQSGEADFDSNQFGQEAIEVLMQFMENDETSLVIMAGYPKEMEDLLNVNAGLNSRISEFGRFYFEDYSPDVLLRIALAKLNGEEYTERFSKDLYAIFSVFIRYKDKDWANARSAGNVINKIKSNYHALQLTGPYDSNAIPDDLMCLIPVISHEEPTEIQKEPDSSEIYDEEPISPENYDDEVETAEEEIQVDYTEQLTSIQESIAALQDVVENLQYNVSMLVQNQASASDVAAMRRENEAFRSDSNMKLMRKYGIDAMIKTYQAVCDKIFRINHPRATTSTAEGEKMAYEWLLRRMERQFKPLGICLKRTEPGSEIDDSVMVVYGSEGEDVDESETIISTEIEELKETVKESVSPAFMWTIPSLIGDGKEWCMEPEKVCIYK